MAFVVLCVSDGTWPYYLKENGQRDDKSHERNVEVLVMKYRSLEVEIIQVVEGICDV